MQDAKLRAVIRKMINEVINEQEQMDLDKIHSTINRLFTRMEKLPEWNKINKMTDKFKADAVKAFIEKLGVSNTGYVQQIIKTARGASK